MTLKTRVGIRIRVLRKRRGFTQERLGEAIDRSADAVSQMERGIIHPSFDTLERLAATLDVTVADFFMFDEPETPARRTSLTITLADLARKLSEDDLEAAIQILETLAQRSK